MRRESHDNFDVAGASRHGVLVVDDDHDAIVGKGPIVAITRMHDEPREFECTFLGLPVRDHSRRYWRDA